VVKKKVEHKEINHKFQKGWERNRLNYKEEKDYSQSETNSTGKSEILPPGNLASDERFLRTGKKRRSDRPARWKGRSRGHGGNKGGGGLQSM